ncbi:hypothetical protein SY88_09920 [Clostridiales bacterium PH28_bin88]|nr:hypothetical protein SY88_09920 [Clostridiales bacterium PH28_bin88]
MVIAQVLVPILLLLATGYLLRRMVGTDPRPISQAGMYVFMPALAINSLSKTMLPAEEAGQIIVFSIILHMAALAVTFAVAKIFRLSPTTNIALQLSTVFPNNGYFGLPLLLFAFGQPGFERGIVVNIVTMLLMFTLGVYLASSARGGWAHAIRAVLRTPLVYASVIGIVMKSLGIVLPQVLDYPVTMLADAAIPLFLVVLGMQLVDVKVSREAEKIALGVILRLVVGPLLAVLLVRVMNITGLTAQVLILASGVPSAVITALLAAEHGAEPELVTGITFVTTLLSFVTLTILLAWML